MGMGAPNDLPMQESGWADIRTVLRLACDFVVAIVADGAFAHNLEFLIREHDVRCHVGFPASKVVLQITQRIVSQWVRVESN